MSNKDVKSKKNKDILRNKLIVYVLTIIITVTFMVFALYYMQTKGQMEYQKSVSLLPLLDEITEEMDSNTEYINTLIKRFHNANQTTLKMVELLFRSGKLNEIQENTDTLAAASALKDITENTGFYSMFIVDTHGKLLLMDNIEFYASNSENLEYNLIKSNKNPSGVFSIIDYDKLTKIGNGWDGTLKTSSYTEDVYEPIYAEIKDYSGRIYRGYYYSTSLKFADGTPTGYYLIAMADADQLENEIYSLKDIKSILSSLGVGKTGFVFSLDAKSGDCIYFLDSEGSELKGNYSEIGLTSEILKDGYSGKQLINGTQYFCVSKIYSSDVFGDKVIIVASMADTELYASRNSNLLWSVLIFFLVGTLVLTYAVIVQVDQIRRNTFLKDIQVLFTTHKGNKIYYNKTLALKLFPLLVIGLAVIWGISIYSQALAQLDTAINISESRIEEIDINVEKNTKVANTIKEFYDKQNLNKANLVADILKRTPEIAFNYDLTDTYHYEYAKTPENNIVLDEYGNPVLTGRYVPLLQELCNEYNLKSIYIFNDKGRVIATNEPFWNFTLGDTPDSQSYEFREVLTNSDYVIQESQLSDTGTMEQFIGTVYYYYTYNDNGVTKFASEYQYKNGIYSTDGTLLVSPSAIKRHRSLVQVGISLENTKEILDLTTLNHVLSGMNMFYNGYFMVFDNDENHSVLYKPSKINPSVFNFDEDSFSGSYNGFKRVNGEKYFVSIRKAGDIFVGTVIPTDTLFYIRNKISQTTVVISFISFVNLLGFMIYSSSNQEEALREKIKEMDSETDIHGSDNFDMNMPDGKKKRVKSISARWRKRFIKWNKKTVEQKFACIIEACSFILFLFVLLTALFSKRLFSDNSIISYILNGNLDRSLNMFVVSRCIVLMIIVIYGTKLIQKVLNLLTVNLGARAETIGHLLESVIRYGGVIGSFFYSLYLVGFNTKSLITSAGILSVIVGLGAQSLISDILAGIFIVFEGEFRVGDIVTVSDFRGTVIEIGIRTTKIEDFLGNIKIYNNSSISGVLNMTKEYSSVPIELSIEYGESLERVESILNEEFPKIQKKIPEIVSGPFYKGVSSMGSSSLNLLIIAQSTEGNRPQVMRALNREIYLAFNKHNIKIPYNKIEVTEPADKSKPATKKEEMAAKKFVQEQKVQSEGIEIIPKV